MWESAKPSLSELEKTGQCHAFYLRRSHLLGKQIKVGTTGYFLLFAAKQERLLRRRAPRNPPANLEASQSSMVSSTSSSPECNASTAKRVSTSVGTLNAQRIKTVNYHLISVGKL